MHINIIKRETKTEKGVEKVGVPNTNEWSNEGDQAGWCIVACLPIPKWAIKSQTKPHKFTKC